MKGKAKDMCPRCKYCEGLDRFVNMYSCKHYNKYPDSAIGMDSEIDCCNFEEINMNKVEGKVSDICPNCKNCKCITRESNGVHDWLTEVECVDPYDGMIKILDADSDICCSMFESKKEKEPFNLNMPREALEAKILDLFEEKNRLNNIINNLEKEKAAHLKGIERLKKSQEKLQNQVNNLQTTNEESYKREEKLEDKCRKLEIRLLDENKRFSRLDSEFLMPLSKVLYPDVKICKPYSEVLKDIQLLKLANYNLKDDNKGLAEKNKTLDERNTNQFVMIGEKNKEIEDLKKDRDNWRDWFYELRYALRKDERLDESISCVRDIPSDVEMIEDLKKRAADSDCYKEMSELLKEKLKKANELTDSWKRDYERIRDQFIYPIYNILYPDKLDLDINVTHLLNDVKDLKIYSEENERMFKELQEWREKCISRGNDIDHLLSENKEKDKKISELESFITYLSNSKKRCKEECEKKNAELNQTISDQEVTIKALLITIKEMCKED